MVKEFFSLDKHGKVLQDLHWISLGKMVESSAHGMLSAYGGLDPDMVDEAVRFGGILSYGLMLKVLRGNLGFEGKIWSAALNLEGASTEKPQLDEAEGKGYS
ncbi:hypothetical protein VTL71DRAFT_12255 [Oculimacula yallundae]|uniref:Uncharacterized protein n=1 Tax=Oculimacula yallundae TaxID=86028 RepID=A0ABR4CSY1_9HELO